MGSSRASIGWIMALWTALTRAGQHGFTFHGQGKREKDAEDRHLFVHYFSNASERPFATGGTYLERGVADGVRKQHLLLREYSTGAAADRARLPSFISTHSLQEHPNTLVNEACCNKSGNK